MGRRDVPEINAGSMADIAFLLLVFFLVTTTINKPEEGIPQKLPTIQNTPPSDFKPKILDWNLLKIKANKDNQLLIDEKKILRADQVGELYQMTLDFFGSHKPEEQRSGRDLDKDGDGFPDYPEREKITRQAISDEIAQWEELLDQYAKLELDTKFFEVMIKKANDKLFVYNQIGEYYALPNICMIKFESDDGTTYGFYLQVLDQMKSAVRYLQDQYCMEKWALTYEQIANNPDLHSDKKVIVDELYPDKKIIDSSNKD